MAKTLRRKRAVCERLKLDSLKFNPSQHLSEDVVRQRPRVQDKMSFQHLDNSRHVN